MSQNRCAFPNCQQSLVEAVSGKVVGRVCHIKAASAGGPRYDGSQDEGARHSFENLILMCPIHHDVIDADTEAYSVERLHRIKSAHESQGPRIAEIPDEAALKFIAEISANKVSGGSIIYSVNQSGGQIAHSIVNKGPQPRSLSVSAANVLVQHLRALPPERYEVETVNGDSEASRLAHQIDNMLSHTGWSATEFATSNFPQHMTGITISYPTKNRAIELLADFLKEAQLHPRLMLLPSLDKVHVLVGSQV